MNLWRRTLGWLEPLKIQIALTEVMADLEPGWESWRPREGRRKEIQHAHG